MGESTSNRCPADASLICPLACCTAHTTQLRSEATTSGQHLATGLYNNTLLPSHSPGDFLSTCNMPLHDLVPIVKRPCPVSSEQLVKRLKLEGVSVPSSARLATLLHTANDHGLLTLAPEPQVGGRRALHM